VVGAGAEGAGADTVGDCTVGVCTVGVDTVVDTVGVLTVGVETVGVLTVGVDTVGVLTVGVDTVGVLRVVDTVVVVTVGVGTGSSRAPADVGASAAPTATAASASTCGRSVIGSTTRQSLDWFRIAVQCGKTGAMARAGGYHDLYEILGVDRSADAATLREAYRARARELHPDVSDEPDAEERFGELTHAYHVLSRPRSRLLYDRLAYRGPGGGGFGPAHEGVGRPTRESAHLSEDELISWIFDEEQVDLAAPLPRENPLLRVAATIALVIAIVLAVVLLFFS